jgi:hypothetical protein
MMHMVMILIAVRHRPILLVAKQRLHPIPTWRGALASPWLESMCRRIQP